MVFKSSSNSVGSGPTPLNEEDEIRLSAFAKAHFNMLGRYAFSMPAEMTML
jgi:hypothetical protein